MNADQLFARAQATIGAADDPQLAIDQRDFDLLVQVAEGQGATKFEKALAISIARAVVNGTYKPSRELFMRNENIGMTGSTGGYVHFRGIHVEHYSFDDREKEAESLASLEADCIAVLTKGMMLTARTAICPLHAEADDSLQWPVAMAMYYCFFRKDDEVAVLFNRRYAPGMYLISTAPEQVTLGEGEPDAYTSFHILQNAGWKAAQLRTYEEFRALIERVNVSDKEIAKNIGYEYASIGR